MSGRQQSIDKIHNVLDDIRKDLDNVDITYNDDDLATSELLLDIERLIRSLKVSVQFISRSGEVMYVDRVLQRIANTLSGIKTPLVNESLTVNTERMSESD